MIFFVYDKRIHIRFWTWVFYNWNTAEEFLYGRYSKILIFMWNPTLFFVSWKQYLCMEVLPWILWYKSQGFQWLTDSIGVSSVYREALGKIYWIYSLERLSEEDCHRCNVECCIYSIKLSLFFCWYTEAFYLWSDLQFNTAPNRQITPNLLLAFCISRTR